MISKNSKHRVTIPCKGLSISHEIRMKSGGFQVKSTPNLVKSEEFLLKHLHLISETSDFTWNPLDFMVKSARFHRFHEISQISWWNLPDFMNMSFWVIIKYRSFYQKTNQMFQQKLFWLVFQKTKDLYLIIMQKLIILKSGRFHVDFMKSLVIAPTLHSSNWRVFAKTLAFIILGGFHRSNLGEICQISWVKSTRLQGEIW